MPFTKEEIQQLLVEKIAGTIDPEDDLQLEQLIAEDKEVRQLWMTMQTQLEESKRQGFSIEVDTDQHWEEIEPLLHISSKSKIVFFTKLAVAASVLALILAGAYWFSNRSLPGSANSKAYTELKGQKRITLLLDDGKELQLDTAGTKSFHYANSLIQTSNKELTYTGAAEKKEWTLTVPAAMDYKMTMADGTEVWLNAETRLRFEPGLSSKTRDVYLEGEAYFNVAKNKLRPFIVHTAQADILVTGTQFNVNTYDSSRFKAALVEGAIMAKSHNSKPLQIKPGFEVVYKSGEGFSTQLFDEAEVLSWMKGVYYFHDTPLQDLAKVVSRWYDVTIHYDNDRLANKMFSGELVKKESLQTFLDYLKISADVKGDIENGVLYFR